MYQGLRGRIKELLFYNLVPRFEETLGTRFLRTVCVVASRVRMEGRLRRVGWHPAPPQALEFHFFIDQRFKACVQTPPPLSKIRFVLRGWGGGGSVHKLTS